MKKLGYGIVGCLVTFAVIGMAAILMIANVGDGVVVEQRTMKPLEFLYVGNDPGAGNSG